MKSAVTLKYLVIGDSGVGKTSLLMRYCEDVFHSDLLSTVGVDFKIKRTKVDGRDVCLNIWDTAGQERFRNITKSFYKNAQGIVLTYSIDNYTSYQHIESWIEQIKENGAKEVDIILVANKADLEQDRKVTRQMGEQLASRFAILFTEVSAKSNQRVEEIFEQLTRSILAKMPEKQTIQKTILTESELEKNKKASKDCC